MMERKRRIFGDLHIGSFSNIKEITFTDIALNKKFYLKEPYKLIIIDDSRRYHKDKINYIINYLKHNNFGNVVGIEFKNISIEFYKDLLNTKIFEIFKKVYVSSIREPENHINDIVYSKKTQIPIHQEIDLKDITKINKDLLNDYNFADKRNFNPSIMNNKEFVNGIDYIAKQISDNASNDLEKILLVDKMLRENTSYDKEYYYNQRPYITKEEQKKHKCHSVQTILRDRMAVCDAFSTFVYILLNHPLINIENKTIDGASYGDPHMWNEVKLNEKWYSYDFTHSLWFDKEKGTKYSMVKKPSERHVKEDGDFEELSELPRSLIEDTYKKLKDVHIRMPRRQFIFTDDRPSNKKQESAVSYEFYKRHKR